MFKLTGTLLVMSFVCALILAGIYKKTAPVIAMQKQIILDQSLKSVLSADHYKYQQKEGIMPYYEAFDKQDKLLGWCLQLTSSGYGGQMQLLVGIDTEKAITGVKVLEHKETPGLGSKINELKYKETEPAFLRQFKNKKYTDLTFFKNGDKDKIQAITGATISSKAVLDGVRLGIEAFLKNY
ncbi:MAG: hypothetical protein DRP78_03925 [Candidatus Omnitrophota bacterium]|nr:MAG: hypothetical protein DRP78_03925 [Candidatus Omnitrophota bacterium]